MNYRGHSPLALLHGGGRRQAQVGSCGNWGGGGYGFNPGGPGGWPGVASPYQAGFGDPRGNGTSAYGAGPGGGYGPANYGGYGPAYGNAYGGLACNGGGRSDRVRYLQAAALAGQVPSIFLGVRTVPPVDSTAPGATYLLAPQSSVPLLITRFEFEDTIASSLDVSSFKITRIDMIAGALPIAGTTFMSTSTAPPIEDPVLPAGVPMQISGTNFSGSEVTIRGTLRGIDLTPWLGWLDTGVGFNGFDRTPSFGR